jgi:hypothetical protein
MKSLYLRHAVFAILLITFLLLFVACNHRAPVNLFPASGEVPGWTRPPEIRTFAPDQLSDYIDGDAEKYINAGVRTADYSFNRHIQVTVDVYTMSTGSGAKLVMDSEPSNDAQFPQLGDAARMYSQSLTFRKGRYLVRMVAYQDSPQLQQAMIALGHAVETKLGGV